MNQRARPLVFALLCGSFLIAPALSEPAKPCAAIKDDAERLKCYDAAAVAKPSAPKTDPTIAKARAIILQQLKDRDSAKFEGIVKRPEAVCGFVNAKNSMGGYTGRKMFVYLIKPNRGWILEVSMPDAAEAIAAAETHCTGVPGF